MRHWRFGITQKLTLVLVLFFALLLSGLGVLVYVNGRASLLAATQSELLLKAVDEQAALDNWVDERLANARALASTPSRIEDVALLTGAAPGSPTAQAAYDRLVRELQPRTGPGQPFLALNIIEPEQAQVIASTDPNEEDKYRETMPYFIDGRDGPYVQNVYYSFASSGPAMTVSAPIKAADGHLLGVLAGHLNLEEMDRIIQRRTGLRQTDDTFLVNTSNLFVTQPRLLPDPAVLQRGIHTVAIVHCLSRTDGVISAPDYRGVPAIIVYRWLADWEMCLIVKMDQSEAYAPVRTFGWQLLFAGGLALLAASALAYVVAQAFTRPILSLQQAAMRFGRGELDARAPDLRHDELGALALEFNQMAASIAAKDAQLRGYAAELEQKVEERTHALAASEAELRALIVAIPDVILVVDAEGRYLKIAPTRTDLLYRPSQELLGKMMGEVLPSELADKFLHWIQSALQGGQTVYCDYSLEIDGQEVHFAASISPMTDNSVLWVARDITQRKRDEDHLRYQAALIESVSDAIVASDAEFRLTAWNETAEALYGWTAAEVLGRNGLEIVRTDWPELSAEKMRGVIAETGRWFGEATQVRKDGTRFPAEISSTTIRDERGQITGYVSVNRDISGREEAQAALRESEERFRTAFEQAAVGIAHVSLAGDFLRLNQRFCDIIGYTQEEMQHLTFQDISYPEDLPTDLHYSRLVLSGQIKTHVTEKRYLCKDGSSVWSNLTASLVREPSGEPKYFMAVIEDISDRKKAEEEIKRINERFALATRSASMGVWEWDLQRNELIWDEQMLRLYGLQKEEFLGAYQAWVQGVHPEDKSRGDEEVQQALRGEKEFDTEFRVLWPNGTLRHIKGYGYVMRNAGGEPLRMTGVNYDITERKEAEEARRRYAARLEGVQAIDRAILAAQSPEAIGLATLKRLRQLIPYQSGSVILFDFANGVAHCAAVETDINLGMESGSTIALSQFSEPDILRLGPVRYIEDIALQTPRPPVLDRLLAEGIRCTISAPLLVQGQLLGELNLAATTAQAFEPEHLEIVREVADQLAIATHQSRLHQSLERHAEELEDRVMARTAELTAANKELEAFSYSVSHDLRAPLRSIDGFSRILLEEYAENLPEDGKRYLNLVRSNTQQMGELVDDLLAFSRLGRHPLNKQAVAPADLARHALDDLRSEQNGRTIDVQIGDLPLCQGDPALLKQVFANLLANALKYTRTREWARIEVGFLPLPGSLPGPLLSRKDTLPSSPEAEIVYFVRDNGVGFDMRYADKLFGIFQRLHRAEEYEGTGVGLAIVQRIINRHGGRVWAEAELDKGATFFFTIGGQND